jgi:hypothetical protein
MPKIEKFTVSQFSDQPLVTNDHNACSAILGGENLIGIHPGILGG